MKKVTIYTDGACSGNPGPGGWGAVLMCGGSEKELCGGGDPETTNNRMELTGIIMALEALKEPCEVTLYTDSPVCGKCRKPGLAEGLAREGLEAEGRTAEKSGSLDEALIASGTGHRVTFVWVKGHAENEYNNRCDELAVAESKKDSGQLNKKEGLKSIDLSPFLFDTRSVLHHELADEFGKARRVVR